MGDNLDRVAKSLIRDFSLHGRGKASFSLSSQINDVRCESLIWASRAGRVDGLYCESINLVPEGGIVGLTRRAVLRLAAAVAAMAVLGRRPFSWLMRHRGRGGIEARFWRRLTVLLLASGFLASSAAQAASVKEPVVAGSFYPAAAGELRASVKRYLKEAGRPKVKGDILALISPHAGYVYSGPVAAAAYRELQGRSYDLVVVIAPSHTAPLNGVSVLDLDAYRTPMGDVPIDRTAARALLESAPWIQYVPALFAREHSLEVQLPFLQEVFGERLRILPLVMGSPGDGLAAALADVLSRSLRGRRVLYVASSDMSHYHGYEEAVAMDRATLDLMAAGDMPGLYRRCASRQGELCGLGPVQVVMNLSRKMGIEEGALLRYANSGDTAGGKDRVVGYGAMAFANRPEDLSLADKSFLVNLARATLETFVLEGRVPSTSVPERSPLSRDGAAFVTLKVNGQLRGCIGQLKAIMPLHRAVSEMAVSACSRDSRFVPVRPDELAGIRVEVSVLSPFIPVEKHEEVTVGRDGLFLSARGRSGVLLPQVPGEQGWDREEFLKEICRKAGLPEEAIRDRDAKLYRFSAQVFGE